MKLLTYYRLLRSMLSLHLILLSGIISYAQGPLAEILGDVKIRGNIDIHHAEDSTSLLIGLEAGKNFNFTENRKNTCVGIRTGGLTDSNAEGHDNSFYGYKTGYQSTSNFNSFFGSEAGIDNTTGSVNTYIGFKAGKNNIQGSSNTFIGAGAGPFTVDNVVNNSIALGHLAQVDCHKCAAIGGIGINAIRVGIGTRTPERYLTLKGSSDDDEPDMAITSNDALIELGMGKEGPHGFSFGDEDDNGMKLLYRTGPNELSIETGTDISTNTSIMVIEESGEVGIGTSSPNDALDVVGDIDATGCIQTGNSGTIGGTCLSDRRLKKNIKNLDNQLQTLILLNPVTYNWKIDTANRAPELGLIAQEVEEIIPKMVITEDDGTKKIRYDISLSIRMIKALQEQQKIIDTQSKEIYTLKEQVTHINRFLHEHKK